MTSFATQLKFTHALSIVRSIPVNSSFQPILADKLRFYGLYKQATEGDVNIPKPSSRQVVEYAKWKTWSRMKGLNPLEAQKLYVESLIQLLTDFLHRYPNHEQSKFIRDALNNLQFDDTEEQDFHMKKKEIDLLYLDEEENFLNHIEADQVLRQQQEEDIITLTSPTNTTTTTTNNSHTLYRRHSSIQPSSNSITGQWVLNQLQHQQNSNRNTEAFEQLQTEVTALTEQIDRLRRTLKSKEDKDKSWSTLGLFKLLLKHVLANSVILCIVLYILWRRKSPIAYAIIGYITPIIRDILRKMFKKIVQF